MRDVGLQTADRDDRLGYTRRIVGRDLASSNELTFAEATLLIDDLRQVAAMPPADRAGRLQGPAEGTVDEDALVAEIEREFDATRVSGQEAAGAPDPPGDPDTAADAGDPAGAATAPAAATSGPVPYNEFPEGF